MRSAWLLMFEVGWIVGSLTCLVVLLVMVMFVLVVDTLLMNVLIVLVVHDFDTIVSGV